MECQRDPPPEVEWWDAALLPNKTYDDMDMGFETLKIWSADSPITEYVQHPIPIPAPWDKNAVALKPLKLTKQVCLRHRLKSVDISTGTLTARISLSTGGEEDS